MSREQEANAEADPTPFLESELPTLLYLTSCSDDAYCEDRYAIPIDRYAVPSSTSGGFIPNNTSNQDMIIREICHSLSDDNNITTTNVVRDSSDPDQSLEVVLQKDTKSLFDSDESNHGLPSLADSSDSDVSFCSATSSSSGNRTSSNLKQTLGTHLPVDTAITSPSSEDITPSASSCSTSETPTSSPQPNTATSLSTLLPPPPPPSSPPPNQARQNQTDNDKLNKSDSILRACTTEEQVLQFEEPEKLDKGCGTLFCIYDFFGCGKREKEREVSSDNHDQPQTDKIRLCLEQDIMNFVGCSAIQCTSCLESDTSIPDNQQNSDDLCTSFQLKCANPNDQDFIMDETSKEEGQNDNDNPLHRLKNRNAFMREKAQRRIDSLRKSGLSREFSLVKVSSFLEENAKSMQREGSFCYNRRTRPSVPSSKSNEWTENGKTVRPESHVEPPSQGFFNAVLGTDQKRFTAIPSVGSEDSEVELYYDSEPCMDSPLFMRKKQLCSDESVSNESMCMRDSDLWEGVGSSSGEQQQDDESAPEKDSDGSVSNTGKAQDTESIVNKLFEQPKSLLETFDLRQFDLNDTKKVTALIKELLGTNLTFIWHKKGLQKQKSCTLPPSRVKLWFEMGVCLKTALVQPKLLWREVIPTINDRQQQLDTIKPPNALELLNIVRVLVPTEINREEYPFVRTQNGFQFITNAKDTFMFEAASEEERKRFVFVMKLMIARLASKIIVGDKDVFEEFFTPVNRRVRRKRVPTIKKKSLSEKDSLPETPEGTDDEIEVEASVEKKEEGSTLCSTLVSPVNEESGRQEELWGSI